jgi:pimeloyl-ACP methyl ester carboxylesterase
MHRRELIGTALACGAMQAAPRPRTFDRLEPCVPDSGIVDWTPDVLHPVSYGYREYAPGESGAPMQLRIFYPSHQPFTEGGGNSAPLLKMCNVRWPLVLFLHGLPPCGPDDIPGYFRRWTRLPTVLAKSGYVVAVPSHEPPDPRNTSFPEESDAAIARAMSVIDWVRGVRVDSSHPGAATARAVGPLLSPRWENADWVHPRATALAGHSFGALLAARVAQARPSISSFVSLSGGYGFLGDPIPLLSSIQARKFFVWADPRPLGNTASSAENLDLAGFWSRIPQPKHAAFFVGEHFDYIRLRSDSECNERRGPCSVIGSVAADLVALFIARSTPVGASSSIPLSLIPPDTELTPNQQFFAGAHLSSLIRFDSEPNCRMTVRWETPEGSGTR